MSGSGFSTSARVSHEWCPSVYFVPDDAEAIRSRSFTPNTYIGKSHFSDPYFNGSINEFRIYNVALTADQIATSFANGPDGTPP
jgi:hypothetical protein